MAQIQKEVPTFIIRKDGTVPFDEGALESHRVMVRQYLHEKGHHHDEIPGTRDLKIHVWPPVKPLV